MIIPAVVAIGVALVCFLAWLAQREVEEWFADSDLITWRNRLEWESACAKWRGEVLTGAKAHYCYAWDGLPVDETTPEFESCRCFK